MVKLHRHPPPLPISSMENRGETIPEKLSVLCRLGQRRRQVHTLPAFQLAVDGGQPYQVGLPPETHMLTWPHIIATFPEKSGKLDFGPSAFCL